MLEEASDTVIGHNLFSFFFHDFSSTRDLEPITRSEQLSYCVDERADVCCGVFLDQSIFRHILDYFLPQKWNFQFRSLCLLLTLV